MIRKAKPQDVSEAYYLAIEALRTERYPTLVVSRERIEAMMKEIVSGPQHFAMVCQDEETGELLGALGAMTSPGMWFERAECSVVMFFCKKPGEGVKMIRAFLKWARSRPIIKRITFTVEFDADPRITKLLYRLGLKAGCPVLMEVR